LVDFFLFSREHSVAFFVHFTNVSL
jgi:hypothetical protein